MRAMKRGKRDCAPEFNLRDETEINTEDATLQILHPRRGLSERGEKKRGRKNCCVPLLPSPGDFGSESRERVFFNISKFAGLAK